MLHHVSIPAKNPEHVARVLAELMGDGYFGPFVGPIPGAFVAYADDEHGTGFEIYREDSGLFPGASTADIAHAEKVAVPVACAFHALLSVRVDRATIEAIGQREGWRCSNGWRGPKGVKLFELYELWIENRVMIEVATDEMLAGYLKIASGRGQRALLEKLR